MPTYTTHASPRMDLGVPFMEYFWGQDTFIGSKVLPIVRSQVYKGKFAKVQREHLLRNEQLRRASRTAYNRDEFEAEDDDFTCEEYGLEIPIGADEQKMYRSDFDSGRVAMEMAALRLLLAYEKRVADAVFNTSTWTGATLYTDVDAGSNTMWQTTASAVPVEDIRAAKEKVFDLTGVVPDTLILNNKNLGYLLNNSDIIGRIKYVMAVGQKAIEAGLKSILGVEKIYVGKGVYNSEEEGVAFSGSAIWSDSYAMVCKTPNTGSLAEPCIGRSVLFAPDSNAEVVAESYWEEQTRTMVYRARHYMDEVIIDASFGHLLKVD